MADQTPPAPGPVDPPEGEVVRGRVRRAPRYRGFVIAGVVVGLVVAVPLVLLWPAERTGTGIGAVLALTALTLAVLGALLGAGLALVADRRSRR
ncbi:hypothetical protein [Cellulomonas bogoriensis]|uniref:Uncharacterized protein n=1 Tax=Cellulomonas bogoriensis 69B4 = DSM 16987 TaxID=1386082 RepID=A0A0A0C211_9CELL|nr:hypothetical protein [Cellulomonas bogoriensis]KGM14195.1 hypothetical protein N869_02960 [Cellulomonas bogoriensis 69B4 = DSM 16987]